MFRMVRSCGNVPNWNCESRLPKPTSCWRSSSVSRTVFGDPADEHAEFDTLLHGRFLALAQLAAHHFDRRGRRVARRQQHFRRQVEEAIHERFEMRPRFFVGSLVGLCDVHRRRPAELIGRGLVAVLARFLFVEPHIAAQHGRWRERLQIGIFAIRGCRPLDRLGAALRGNPHRRMRTLLR